MNFLLHDELSSNLAISSGGLVNNHWSLHVSISCWILIIIKRSPTSDC